MRDHGKPLPKYLIVKNDDEKKKIYKKVKRKEKRAIIQKDLGEKIAFDDLFGKIDQQKAI